MILQPTFKAVDFLAHLSLFSATSQLPAAAHKPLWPFVLGGQLSILSYDEEKASRFSKCSITQVFQRV